MSTASRKPLPTFHTPAVFETPFPTPMGYNVAVKPRPPKRQVGLIATSKRSQEADQALETIGQVLAIGTLAWGPGGGLELTGTDKPAVGDWVVYRQYAGQKLRLRKAYSPDEVDPDGSTLQEFILVMVDTDVLAKFGSLREAESFYAWI